MLPMKEQRGAHPKEKFGGMGDKASKPTDKLNKEPLYLELLAIGRDERSIEPDALRRYKRLLESPEVRRRAYPSTDPDDLAKHASEALGWLIERCDRPGSPRQLVAKVALGLQEGYEELSVAGRESKLEEEEHFTENMFKYHRQMVFEEMVKTLEDGDPPESTDDGIRRISKSLDAPFRSSELQVLLQRGLPAVDAMSGNFMALAHAAAQLHFAILACSFSNQFNYDLGLTETNQWGLQLISHHPGACAKHVLDAYAAFGRLARWFEALKEPPARVSAGTSEQIRFLIKSIGFRSAFLIPFLRTDRTQRAADSPSEPPPGLASSVALHDKDLEIVSAKAGALALMIGSHVGYESASLSDARKATHKTLAYYYSFDPYEPICNGESMKSCADRYFDSKSLSLANSALVWHDKEDKM